MSREESWNAGGQCAAVKRRTEELLGADRQANYRQTDRLFVILMAIQWMGGMIMAQVVSPLTWIGATSQLHLHVWAAIVLGGAISAGPMMMGLCLPGSTTTRHVIAVGQAVWSALLIHLSGGRIETHFHVFGSLAFLSFYRDWRVLMTASLVIVLDHLVRGMWWPQSVYGIFVESPYRWIEHAGWVIFEDIFLVISCVRAQRQAREIWQRHAVLEETKAEIELHVQRRTRQLEEAQLELETEFVKHRETQQEREQLYTELARASRQAGMAEVATGVLHNVGNVLNSVNVSANLLLERLRRTRIGSLAKAAEVIAEHQADLAAFLTKDERGRHFPRLLKELATTLGNEHKAQIKEIGGLIDHVEHVKEVVNMQQAYACAGGTTEPVTMVELAEDALKINDAGLIRHSVQVVRDFEEISPIFTEKHKVLQILVNLISNAKYALSDSSRVDKTMTLTVRGVDENIRVQVCDNGVGIAPENLTKIFHHGFTTKKDGHGFGLHSSGLAAQELGGSLTAHSDGPECGATFTLTLPAGKQALCKV